MKNKKSEQIAKKLQHKEELKLTKLRRREPDLLRNEPYKSEKQSFLIYCEGKNTEPSYFTQFRLTNATIKSFGDGFNTVSLVQRAYELSREGNYDQVWCVFDADPKPDNQKQLSNFNDAVFLANKYKQELQHKYIFDVAYSNQAFEYWLILHFEDHQGLPMARTGYASKLNSYLKRFGVKYDEDNKLVTEAIFDILQAADVKGKAKDKQLQTSATRQHLAIERAERIYNKYDHKNPAKEESSTTVFVLVRELMKYK